MRVIKEARCGVVVSPVDVEAIAAALCDMYQGHSKSFRESIHDSFIDRFDARYQSEKLEQIALRLTEPVNRDAVAIATHN